MQTAQIQIDGLYAIHENGQVVRFRVTEILTVSRRTKKDAKPDTVNTIIGVIPQEDMPEGDDKARSRQLSPDKVISSYAEHTKLKAKQEEEDRIRNEEAQRKTDLRERLRAKLYEVTGLSRPAKPTEKWGIYQEPFEDDFGTTITIRFEAMEILLETLNRITNG